VILCIGIFLIISSKSFIVFLILIGYILLRVGGCLIAKNAMRGWSLFLAFLLLSLVLSSINRAIRFIKAPCFLMLMIIQKGEIYG
jgi:hypothetical protein